jgi:hypothetical protein
MLSILVAPQVLVSLAVVAAFAVIGLPLIAQYAGGLGGEQQDLQ